MVLWYGRSCQEVCGTKLWVAEQNDSTTPTKYQLYALTTIISKKKNWNPWDTFSEVCSQRFPEMLKLAPYWTTRYSMISEQICTNDHIMDQRAWQKIISFDLLHSSYMCLQNDIFMWETLQSNADWANTQTHTKGMRRQRRHTRKERERERQRKHARTVRERAAKTHDRERYETGDNPSLTITTSVHDLVVFFTECLMCGRNQELHLPRERWHQTVSFSKMCMCPYLRFWVKCWIRSSPRRRSA